MFGVYSIIKLTCFTTLYLVYTVAFIFWFSYLLRDLIYRRACYKSALRRLHDCSDQYQQEVVYMVNTIYVKSKFLFSLNIIGWLSETSNVAAYIYEFIEDTLNCVDVFDQPTNASFSGHLLLTNNNSDCLMGLPRADALTFSNLLLLGNNLKIMGLMLIACMGRYLTARYARKSWIKHNEIPYIITLTVVYIFITQISSVFHYYVFLLVRWIQWVAFISVVAFVIWQGRKLLIVIKWMIVDLEISQNYKGLLTKFKLIHKRVKKVIALVSIASICFSILILITNIGLVIGILLSRYGTTLNKTTHYASLINRSFDIISVILYVVPFIIVFGPFLGNGLVAISVLTCRCVRGKTGYRTHFANPLRTKLLISKPGIN